MNRSRDTPNASCMVAFVRASAYSVIPLDRSVVTTQSGDVNTQPKIAAHKRMRKHSLWLRKTKLIAGRVGEHLTAYILIFSAEQIDKHVRDDRTSSLWTCGDAQTRLTMTRES